MVQQQIFAQSKTIREVKIKSNFESTHCKARIEKAVAFEKGVKSVNADISSKTVIVQYDQEKISKDQILSVIKNLGYEGVIESDNIVNTSTKPKAVKSLSNDSIFKNADKKCSKMK